MKNRGFTLTEIIGVVIILGMIVLIAFPPLLNVIRGTNEEITNANKTLLLSAADQYTDTYKNDFPKNEGNVYCISYGDLIKEELIPSNIPNKDGQTLDYNTKIKVSVNNGKYEYSVDNSCERHIKITSLVEILKQQYNESNTTGLLKDDAGYYYKGTNTEVANNFVWFGGHLWRVISIDNDNNITMITQQPLTAIQPASAVWTTQAEYEASYINHWLNNETDGVFYKSLEQEDKNKILNSTFNVGGEYNSTTKVVENIDSITTVQKVGLLDETQYTKAGGTNSFLDIKDNFWLGNRYRTSSVRYVVSSGVLNSGNPWNPFGVRAVIKISNLTFTAGKGTLDDPYREKSTTTNTSDIKVGEYVSIPTSGNDCGTDKRCLFRVVNKDNNSIKVIFNGLLPNVSAFDANGNSTYTSGNTVDTVVTAFAGTINSAYRYTGTGKTFGIGAYPYVSGTGQNYTAVQTTTYPGNVGLPVIGEMFSGNDIDMTTGSTAKTFVNVATMENPTVADNFWTMNAYDTLNVRYVISNCNLSYYNSSYASGVRAVLFLKNNLTFTSGEGTAENPFTLE